MTKRFVPKLLNIQNTIPPNLFRRKKPVLRPKIYQLDWYILVIIFFILGCLYYLNKIYGESHKQREKNLNKTLYNIKNY